MKERKNRKKRKGKKEKQKQRKAAIKSPTRNNPELLFVLLFAFFKTNNHIDFPSHGKGDDVIY